MATSHGAQGNTIEFTYGLQWRVLQEQQDVQWRKIALVFSHALYLGSLPICDLSNMLEMSIWEERGSDTPNSAALR